MNANTDRPKSIDTNFQQNAELANVPHTSPIKATAAKMVRTNFCRRVKDSSVGKMRSPTIDDLFAMAPFRSFSRRTHERVNKCIDEVYSCQ